MTKILPIAEYSYNADVTDWVIWVRYDDGDRELYARVSGASAIAIQRMVNTLNQMEIEG